jgi:ATP-dependent protease ClpP protease subunit
MKDSEMYFWIAMGIFLMIMLSIVTEAKSTKQPDINPGNSVYLSGELTEERALETGSRLMEMSQKMGRSREPIYLVIDTRGGNLLAERTLAATADILTHEIATVTCFSAGTGFNLVQRLGRRYIAEKGIMVAVRPIGGLHGVTAGEMVTKYDQVRETINATNIRNSNRMGITVDEFIKMTENELWVTGKDVVSKGAADEVVSQTVCK